MSLFLKGLAIGFAIAAPVGPIGLLCIRRTLTDGRLAGFVAGLGAATADALYGAIAAFGLTLVIQVLVEQREWLALGGSLFLCWLGIEAWRAEPARLDGPSESRPAGLAACRCRCRRLPEAAPRRTDLRRSRSHAWAPPESPRLKGRARRDWRPAGTPAHRSADFRRFAVGSADVERGCK